MVLMAVGEIEIRSYQKVRDSARVQDLERQCEVGPRESTVLVIDMMGDPTCRVRNCTHYKILVAELENELVGVVRGSIKMVTYLGNPAKVGYVLGLRVSPLQRRRGIATRLVERLEDWFHSNSVDYAYMATERDNKPSLNLFIQKLRFLEFRTPAILVNPVGRRATRAPSSAEIIKVKTEEAEHLYQRHMGTSTDFFPHDIDKILENKLNLGTWVAYPRGESWSNSPAGRFPASSWAMLSVWNTGDVFKLRVGRAPIACVLSSKVLSFIDRAFPCLRVPTVGDIFTSFGFYFMYGLHGEGTQVGPLIRSLCLFVHNLATKSEDCKAIVTEVDPSDPLMQYIPHSKLLSTPEDLWCIKPLREKDKETHFESVNLPSSTLFVDPREV